MTIQEGQARMTCEGEEWQLTFSISVVTYLEWHVKWFSKSEFVKVTSQEWYVRSQEWTLKSEMSINTSYELNISVRSDMWGVTLQKSHVRGDMAKLICQELEKKS